MGGEVLTWDAWGQTRIVENTQVEVAVAQTPGEIPAGGTTRVVLLPESTTLVRAATTEENLIIFQMSETRGWDLGEMEGPVAARDLRHRHAATSGRGHQSGRGVARSP